METANGSDNQRITGQKGENAACRYLEDGGYTILDRNYRAERYEIDIVARRGDTVVFCEVKTSRTRLFGSAVSWVTPAKTRRIAQAAFEYIRTHDLGKSSYRFDVIGIDHDEGGAVISHIENAFSVPEDE
jgi:putative endonuclease